MVYQNLTSILIKNKIKILHKWGFYNTINRKYLRKINKFNLIYQWDDEIKKEKE